MDQHRIKQPATAQAERPMARYREVVVVLPVEDYEHLRELANSTRVGGRLQTVGERTAVAVSAYLDEVARRIQENIASGEARTALGEKLSKLAIIDQLEVADAPAAAE